MAYSKILRRLRDGKTNYRRRKAMLMGKRDYVTVLISNENTFVQVHKPKMTGDQTLASAHSRFLISKGWKGSRKNIPASYLTGYMAGKKALKAGVNNAILYTGTNTYSQRMAAALKGVIDAGIEIPSDSETFPAEERIAGEHLTVKNDFGKIKLQIENEGKSE